MEKILKSNPTPAEFAAQWAEQFEKALKTVAKDGKVNESAGEKLEARKDALRVFGDNVVHFLHFSGQDEVETKKMLDAGRQYAQKQAGLVAGANGKISDAQALKLSSDLVADFYVLRGKSLDATLPKAKPADVDAALKLVYPANGYADLGESVSTADVKNLSWPIRKCVDDYDAIWGSDYPSDVIAIKSGDKTYYLVNQVNDGGMGIDVYTSAGSWLLGMTCSESGEPNWSLALGELTDKKLKELGLDT